MATEWLNNGDLRMVNHGGMCCGIKTIYNFGYYSTSPDEMMGPLEKIPPDWADSYGNVVSSTRRFFHFEAPQETRLARLDRFLDYLREYRPQHIVEVVLSSAQMVEDKWNGGLIPSTYLDQVEVWERHLVDRGFKLVTKAVNSNSLNYCNIYHLVINEEED